MRADALDGLSEAGWRALVEYCVRTVIDLRNDDERRPDAARHPRGVQMLRIPLDVAQDREFWDVLPMSTEECRSVITESCRSIWMSG